MTLKFRQIIKITGIYHCLDNKKYLAHIVPIVFFSFFSNLTSFKIKKKVYCKCFLFQSRSIMFLIICLKANAACNIADSSTEKWLTSWIRVRFEVRNFIGTLQIKCLFYFLQVLLLDENNSSSWWWQCMMLSVLTTS